MVPLLARRHVVVSSAEHLEVVPPLLVAQRLVYDDLPVDVAALAVDDELVRVQLAGREPEDNNRGFDSELLEEDFDAGSLFCDFAFEFDKDHDAELVSLSPGVDAAQDVAQLQDESVYRDVSSK